MALATIPGGGVTLMPMPLGVSSQPNISISATSFRLDTSSEQCGLVFVVPRTGNIRALSFLVGTVTSAPSGNHDVRLETVDAGTGINTGTLAGTTTNGAILLSTTGWKSVTLTADAAVTAGQQLALMVQAPASDFGDVTLADFADESWAAGVPYSITTTGAKSALALIAAVEYDDGAVVPIPGLWPLSAVTIDTFSNASTPDRRGLRFQAPGPMRLAGCTLWVDTDGDFDVVFYAADGTSATTVFDGDKDLRQSAAAGCQHLTFSTAPTLAANTTYRLVIVPTTTTALTLYGMTVAAAKYLDAVPGGQACHFTTADGAPSVIGDWTDTTTQRPWISLRIDQVDDGAAGGGSTEAAYPFIGAF